MEAAAARANTPPQVRGANPASSRRPHRDQQATRGTRVSRRRPTALSPPDTFRPSAPASRSRAGPRTPSLSGPARSTSKPPGPRLPAVRPPSGPSNAAFTSPQVSAAVPDNNSDKRPSPTRRPELCGRARPFSPFHAASPPTHTPTPCLLLGSAKPHPFLVLHRGYSVSSSSHTSAGWFFEKLESSGDVIG